MRRYLKKGMFCSVLVFSMCMIPLAKVKAESVYDEVVVPEVYALDNARYGEREEITVLNVDYKTTTVTPSGQPPHGTRFPTGGGLYVNTSGGPTISVGFGVNWGETVSTSVSIGSASTNNIGGIYLVAPNKTNYFIAKIDKKYKIEKHKVDVYQYNEYKYTYYTTISKFYSESAYMVKV